MTRCITSLLLFTVNILTIYAITKECSGSQNGESFCQYDVGDVGTKIIISAPHGGSLKPSDIETRDAGCFVSSSCVYSHTCVTKDSVNCPIKTLRDSYTKELAIQLADELKALTGYRPHLIINNLHRSKMDGNREINEATFGDPAAIAAFNEFHGFIDEAKNTIIGRGLFIDMHGQTHTERWNELGYMVIKSRLNSDTPLAKYSSLKYAAGKVSVSFDDLIRGSNSLGQLLQDEGYSAIPSVDNKKPGSGNYYSGGYNTKLYGSRYSGMIDGVQMETHKDFRNAVTGPNYAKALARSVKTFMDLYY